MNTVRIFIPRILPNVTNQMMKTTFNTSGLGEAINIDIRHRINAHNYHYAFAFILVKLYDTDYATQAWKDIVEKGSYQMVYDAPNYWELKNYIARDQRDYYEEEEEEEEVKQEENIIIDVSTYETDKEILYDKCDQPTWSEIVNRKYPKLHEDNELEKYIQTRVNEYIETHLDNIIIQRVMEMPSFPGLYSHRETSQYVKSEVPADPITDIQKMCYELSKKPLPDWSTSQNVYQKYDKYPSAFSLLKPEIYNLADDYTSMQNDIWNTVHTNNTPYPSFHYKTNYNLF